MCRTAYSTRCLESGGLKSACSILSSGGSVTCNKMIEYSKQQAYAKKTMYSHLDLSTILKQDAIKRIIKAPFIPNNISCRVKASSDNKITNIVAIIHTTEINEVHIN